MFGKQLAEDDRARNTDRGSNCLDSGERRGNRVQDR